MFNDLTFNSSSSESSGNDDDDDNDSAIDDEKVKTFQETRKLSRTRGQLSANLSMTADSLIRYERNLIKYHDEMERWSMGRQESLDDQDQLENTLIELIRIFVSENGRVPTDIEIQEVLESTADELTKIGGIDDDDDGDNSTSKPPPMLPERPLHLNTHEYMKLSHIEERYIGEDDVELQRRLSKVRSIKTTTSRPVPHGFAVKVANNSRMNWKSLKLVCKWVKLGGTRLKSAKNDQLTKELRKIKAPKDSIHHGRPGSLWHKVKIHIRDYRAVTRIKGAVAKRKQAADAAEEMQEWTKHTSEFGQATETETEREPGTCRGKQGEGIQKVFESSSADLISLLTREVRSKISKWSMVRKNMTKSKVDDVLNSWMSSWTSNMDELDMITEKRGDIHLVRDLFESIDCRHRDFFGTKELTTYLHDEHSPLEWPKHRVEALQANIGADSKGRVTWLSFAMTENILNYFDISYATYMKGRASRRRKKAPRTTNQPKRSTCTSISTSTSTSTPHSSLPANNTTHQRRAIRCAPVPAATTIAMQSQHRHFSVHHRKKKQRQQPPTNTRKWTPAASNQKKHPQRPQTAQHRSHRDHRRTPRQQRMIEALHARPQTASAAVRMRKSKKKKKVMLRHRLTKSPLSQRRIETKDSSIQRAKKKLGRSNKRDSSPIDHAAIDMPIVHGVASETPETPILTCTTCIRQKSPEELENEYNATSQAVKEWAANLCKDWVHWLATADPSVILQHLQKSKGGVNTIVDRLKRRTALHYAAETGDTILVRELCRDPRTLCQVEDWKGETALDLALKHRHMVIANILLENMISTGQWRISSACRVAAAMYG